MNIILEKAKRVKCLICDVDGVLSDGLLYLDNYGNELKTFHVQDGMGLKLLMAAGIEVAIITTSQNEVIDRRMQQLGIEYYFKGCLNKWGAFIKLQTRLGLNMEEFAYIGDDLPDLELIKQLGLGIAVANAMPQIKEHAQWETTQKGGQGAVREVCELILHAQHKHEIALARYLAS